MTPRRESADLRRLTLLYQLFLTSQASTRFVRRALADTDMSGETYALYSYLYENGPRTPSEAARNLGYPITTFASRLGPLVTAGEISRRPHPMDRRAVIIELSDTGQQRLLGAIPRFRAAYRALEATLRERGTDPADLFGPIEELREAMELTMGRLDTEIPQRLAPEDTARRGA
jgi:DNA-binding MarR family transcriptional regulator